MESFELYLFSFGAFSFDLCSVAARVLVVCELLLGLGLISGLWRRCVNVLSAVMLAGFSAFLIWRIAVGDSGSCHCFGDVVDMNPVQSLLKNAVLGVLLAVCWPSEGPLAKYVRALAERLPGRVDWTLAAGIVVSVGLMATVFIVNPPDAVIRFRHRDSEVDLAIEKWPSVADSLGLSGPGRKAVLLFSPSCEHCLHCASKLSEMVRRHDLPQERFHVVFMAVTDDEAALSTMIDGFYEMAGIGDMSFQLQTLDVETMIPLTYGLLPQVCLFDGDSLVADYDGLTLDEAAIVNFFSE